MFRILATIRGPYGVTPNGRAARNRGPPKTPPDVNLSTWERDTEMKMLNILKRFQKDEDGAVTVDWVVLTAAVVGLGLIVMAAIRPAIGNLSTAIAEDIEAAAP